MSQKRSVFAHISSDSIVSTHSIVHTTPQNSKFIILFTVACYVVAFISSQDSDKSVVGRGRVLVRFGTVVGYLAGD